MQPWPERFPGRLQDEQARFKRTPGLLFDLDEELYADRGLVVFNGTISLPGREPVRLQVRYPETYPYLRPEVFAPELHLERHQNPYRHNLCLLERSTRHWTADKTGAWLVGEQLPELLRLIDDPEVMRREEAAQGEPASYYFGRAPDTVVLIPQGALELDSGERAGRGWLSIGQPEARSAVVRACLTRLDVPPAKKKRRKLFELQGPLAERFGTSAYQFSWVRIDQFPNEGGDAETLAAAARAAPGFEAAPETQTVDGWRMTVIGVVCREEVRQGVWEDSWLFVLEVKPARDPRARRQTAVVKGDRFAPQDLLERIPTLVGLSDKTVALVGLGALGAPLALELARAQIGRLRLLDGDYVEAGTIVRWPFGTNAVGRDKAGLLASHIGSDYPYTRTESFPLAIGRVSLPGEPDAAAEELEALERLLDGCDLLIDASAEQGVSQLLSALADERGVPQVTVEATLGGWGGMVARIMPPQTGCWYCLQAWLGQPDGIPLPPAAPNDGYVQPRGCSTPTWTGTSFSALPLVAQAARTACFTLLAGRAGDEPEDVFICQQPATGSADLHAPQWDSFALRRHPSCTACAARPS